MRRKLVSEQRKHTAIKSQKLTLELDAMKKSLISRAEAARELDMVILACRTHLLALHVRITPQIVAAVHGTSDPHLQHVRVSTLINEAVYEALANLGGVGDPAWAERMDAAVTVAMEMMGHE